MSKVEKYRSLTNNELDEIKKLSEKAKIKLKLSNSNIEETLDVLDEFVDIFDSKKHNVEEISFELGSLYGNLFLEKYKWNWYSLTIDSDEYYAVVSNDFKVVNIPFNYFHEILKGDRDNNFVLTFNNVRKYYPEDWRFQIIT